MIKISSTDDFNFDLNPTVVIHDTKQLVKRASVKDSLVYEKTPNQTDVHVVALGCGEKYAKNRNNDYFPEESCRRDYQTFTKANRAVHHNHKNKKTDPKYGNIKAAAWNENMGRIELIIGLDNDNPANQESLQKLASGDQIQVSMATKLPNGDVCSWCGHRAQDENSRCEHIPAKLGEFREDGVDCHMINDQNNWFEISIVKRGACRVAHSLNNKLASDSRFNTSKDYLTIYPGIEIPQDEPITISKKASEKRALIKKLSEMEKHIDALGSEVSSKPNFIQRQAKALNHSKKIDDKDIDELRKHNPKKSFKAMSDKGIILGPEEFIKYLFGGDCKPELADGMRKHLPHAFNKLEDEGKDEVVNDEKFTPDGLDMLPKELRNLVSKMMPDHSLFSEPSTRRVISITISMGGKLPKKEESKDEHKTASEKYNDEKLAEIYTNYKLAQLQYLDEQGKLDDILMYNCLIQNRG